MSQLKVGDRVQWWEEFKNTKLTPRMMTGTVQSCHSGGNPWVGIQGDGEGFLSGTWVRNISELTRLPTPDAVAASEGASVSPFQPICTDYERLLEMGDYGGREA